MSIKRLALCRSQGRLFVLLRFVSMDVAGIIECEGSQAFAHASIMGVCWHFALRLLATNASSPSWCFRF